MPPHFSLARMLAVENSLTLSQVVWRFPIAFQNVFALLTALTLPFLPETPRYVDQLAYVGFKHNTNEIHLAGSIPMTVEMTP